MDASTLAALLLVAALLYVVVRARRFGGVGPAFSRAHKQQRADLTQAQQTMRDLRRQRDAELAPRRQAAQEAVAAYERAVRVAEARLAAEREPGTGRQLARLGPVALHEHALSMAGAQIPLTGLQVFVQPTYNTCALVVQLPDGRRTSHPFSTEWRQDDRGCRSREYEDGQVQHLCDAIHNAVVAEHQFRADQPRRIAEAEQAYARQVADTARMATELARLDEAQQAASSTDAALRAHEQLLQLEDEWTRLVKADKKQPGIEQSAS